MPSPDDVQFISYRPGQASELLDPICALYDLVFAQAPFRWTDDESEHHRQSLTSLLTNSTFGLVTASTADGLVGFAYGFRLPPQTGWWGGFQEALPIELTTEYEGRTFALIDTAVVESYRGQGIGRRLLDLLLASRDEKRATLCVQPTAADTQAIYRHLGWHYVGRCEAGADAVSPFWDVYVLSLRDKP